MSSEDLQQALVTGKHRAEQVRARGEAEFDRLRAAVKAVLEGLPEYLGCTDGRWYDVQAKTPLGPARESLPPLIQTAPTETDWHVAIQMVLPPKPPLAEPHVLPLDFTLPDKLPADRLRFGFAGAHFDIAPANLPDAREPLFEHVKAHVRKSLENDHKSGVPIG